MDISQVKSCSCCRRRFGQPESVFQTAYRGYETNYLVEVRGFN